MSEVSGIQQVLFKLPNGGEILFTHLQGEMIAQEEFAEWTPKYQEAASHCLPGDPLIVDVIAEGLRTTRR